MTTHTNALQSNMSTCANCHFSLDASLRKKSFWMMMIAVGYIIAVNGMLLGSGGSIALLTLPTVLLPLIPAYCPSLDRFRLTVILSIPTYFVVVAVFLYNSMLPFSLGSTATFGTQFLLSIPFFFIRGPLMLSVGDFEGIGEVSGFCVALLVIGILRKVSTVSDSTLKFLLAFLIVSFGMGFVEAYELGMNVGVLGDGIYFVGSKN